MPMGSLIGFFTSIFPSILGLVQNKAGRKHECAMNNLG